MLKFKIRLLATILLSVGGMAAAHAQWAVVDVGAIAQLLQQVQLMEQELKTAQNDLAQAQQAYQSMTGPRGMQMLLSGVNRNYLPSTWTQVQSAASGSGGSYGALSSTIQKAITVNAVLSAAMLATLSPDERSAILARRQSAATMQAMSQTALSTTSTRFASLQQLINAIPTATDQKAILELQARIGAEQGMLANEHTKLSVLYQATLADEAATRQRTREQAIASVGSLRSLPAMGL